MSTNKLEIPELKIVNENTKKHRTQTPEAIKRLLLPINKLELYEDDDSDYSELSDKYQDLQKEDCRLKTYKNQSVLDIFTEDYKDTAMELRQELHITNSVDECFSHTSKIKKPCDLKSAIYETDETIDLKEFSKETVAENGFETIVPEEIWNLLLVNSKDATFQITPPNYNCFKQEKRHWLETPRVPWKVINNSIMKCQKWLEDQEECQ